MHDFLDELNSEWDRFRTGSLIGVIVAGILLLFSLTRLLAALRTKARFAAWFLNNAESVQVQGTVVAVSDNKLILNNVADQIRVHLPAEWTVNNEVLTREELLTSGYMSAGETITIQTLQAQATNKQGVTI